MIKPIQNIFLKLSVLITLIFTVCAFTSPCYSQSNNPNQPVFNHAALCAVNLKKTTAFYTDVLQLKLIPNPFHDTTHSWFKIGPGLALHVIQGNCLTTTHDIAIHLCFSVPLLDAFMQHLDKLHITYGNWEASLKKSRSGRMVCCRSIFRIRMVTG